MNESLLLASAILGFLVGAAILWRWQYGLYLLLALIPFENSFVFGGFRDGLKVLAAITVISMLFRAYLNGPLRQRL